MRRTNREQQDIVTSDAPISRRAWIGAAGTALGAVLVARRLDSQKSPLPAVTVYRSPTCSCCGKWSQRMEKYGFKVTEKNLDDVTPKKREQGIPESLYSCHTAVIGAYVFEGHVPPDLVERVVRERPAFRGLAAPGMPQSAPGMDIGHTPYEVIAFERNGKTRVYATRSS
jgi:hypothetical protein